MRRLGIRRLVYGDLGCSERLTESIFLERQPAVASHVYSRTAQALHGDEAERQLQEWKYGVNLVRRELILIGFSL